jgi:hypothetical protein
MRGAKGRPTPIALANALVALETRQFFQIE